MPVNQRVHLNRALSKLGLCSRAQAVRWIKEGKVSVNQRRADDPELWVEPGKDRIEVDGVPDSAASSTAVEARPRAYLRMHKPAGFVTTHSDELGRKTVYDLLPPELRGGWVFPVGRLDKDSEGLLLMTNDAQWAERLTNPDFHMAKQYRVKLDGKPREEELNALRDGVEIAGRKTLPAEIAAETGGWYRVTLREGRNRQIRKMFHSAGYKVRRLIRVAIGPLSLGELQPGEVKRLAQEWVEALRGR